MNNKSNESRLDKPLFFSSILFTAIIVAYSTFNPESAQAISGAMFHWVTYDAGFLVLGAALACFFFLIWFSISKYGRIKLGDKDAKPDFTFGTYAFMMFTSGVGSSLIYWAMGEPMYYLSYPPMHVEPNSLQATMWAITYPLYHWGPVAWAIYCLPGLPFAYYLHNRRQRTLRLSNVCEDVIGKKNADGVLGYIINVLAVFGTMCAVSTGIGFCSDLIASGFSAILGTPNTFFVQFLVVAAFVAVFTVVVLAGIKKGVARLSNLCVYIAFGLGLYVLLVSNTGFILDYFFESVGFMFQNFFRMSTWLDPVGKDPFAHDWTVYYWAWYFAYLVMMGLFLAKISKGRTFRQMILTCVIFGSCGCAFFTGIFGGYAVGNQTSGTLPIAQWISDLGTSAAVIKLISVLPLGGFVLIVFLIVQFFLMSTTLTSATYSLAMMSSKNLAIDEEPDNNVKVAWAFAVGGMSLVALLMGGSIAAIKSITVVAGFPMIIMYVIIMLSLKKWLKKDMKTATEDDEGNIIINYIDDESDTKVLNA
ncbi:MAG: BCCT family transporter [Tissierellales bacterium]|nr:BCCT family transporter [Tissierellales bacterium]MBN2826912.1 BCCT family transporter [Tissierellales bacterium]